METRYAQFVRGRSIMVYHPNGSADPLDQVKPAVEGRLVRRSLDPDNTKALLRRIYDPASDLASYGMEGSLLKAYHAVAWSVSSRARDDQMAGSSFLITSKLLYLRG